MIKSSSAQLNQRGYLPDDKTPPGPNISSQATISLLKSHVATERTMAARNLAHSTENSAVDLIEALRIEKKLYTKIELCNALVTQSPFSIKPLIGELGKIGNNQHKTIPSKAFKKDSYPLPRDIAARILSQIGAPPLPELQRTLKTENRSQLSETIDAFGHICFYSRQPKLFDALRSCWFKNSTSELIKWKIIRAMSAFPESLDFLKKELTENPNPALTMEIERSIRLIKMLSGA